MAIVIIIIMRWCRHGHRHHCHQAQLLFFVFLIDWVCHYHHYDYHPTTSPYYFKVTMTMIITDH